MRGGSRIYPNRNLCDLSGDLFPGFDLTICNPQSEIINKRGGYPTFPFNINDLTLLRVRNSEGFDATQRHFKRLNLKVGQAGLAMAEN